MTPQERQMIDDLFDRLAKLEGSPRDADAVNAIAQGQRIAPNAVYALVQTVLIQDEALKRANARIQELEGGGEPAQSQNGGFLGTMRDALFGANQSGGRGSVPNVSPPGQGSRPVWNTGRATGQPQPQYGQPYGQQPQPGYGQPQAQGGGSSFLGTAAAAAAGMVGGSLLLGSIRSMMGGHQQGFGDSSALGGSGEGKNPWSSDQSGSGLGRDAGVNDIGSSGQRAETSNAGSFDQAQADADQDQDQDQDDYDSAALDSDGFDGGGDSDSA